MLSTHSQMQSDVTVLVLLTQGEKFIKFSVKLTVFIGKDVTNASIYISLLSKDEWICHTHTEKYEFEFLHL